MKDEKLIITINREFGSGGREIAYKLGALLDMKVYDKNVLEEIEQEYDVPNQLPDDIYALQKKILLNIASKESCIIVGRTGFHIFKNHPNVVRVLLIADYDARVKHVSEKHGITKIAARKRIKEVDREREEYTKKYTGVSRYDARNYDFVLNVTNIPGYHVAAFLAQNIRMKFLKK
ncbi:MAG: cytidylate kinase-like family protein [Bacteroidales bacterium]|nr:cytidylate kinase-like family protein [Bacteroidales bacterium]MBR4138144.1 cytidylate kinase-like family protein [Bacteroidales bacterium]